MGAIAGGSIAPATAYARPVPRARGKGRAAVRDRRRGAIDTRKQKDAPNAKADNVQQAVRLAEATKLYADADLKSSGVRTLQPGMLLYPTGDKVGVWWQVSGEARRRARNQSRDGARAAMSRSARWKTSGGCPPAIRYASLTIVAGTESMPARR